MSNMRLFKFYTMFNYLMLFESYVEKNLKESMVPKHYCTQI